MSQFRTFKIKIKIMEQNRLITYRFFDNRKRRLSIFGEYNMELSGLVITVFTCSKQDVFCKKTARGLYKIFKNISKESPELLDLISLKPKVFILPCDEKKTKLPFMEFCESNFKKELNKTKK